jgi:hypothetical protein
LSVSLGRTAGTLAGATVKEAVKSPEPLAVSVLAYEPQIDQSDGHWYCDITVDHGAAYFPFLQPGLVRYQPHSVNGLELSRSVASWAQIPPRREGRVVF